MLPPPRPSSGYIERVARTQVTQVKKRRQLIVFDLNGTLIATKSRNDKQRPHLAQLQKMLFDHHRGQFDVMVYSSAMRHNVARYVDSAFNATHRQHLKAVYTREDMSMSARDYKNKVQTYKDLELVWHGSEADGSDADAEHPQYSQYNTILVDDSAEKAAFQPWNLLQVSTWDGSSTDSMLVALLGVLDDIRGSNNVSHYLSTYTHVRSVDPHADTATPWFDIPHVYAHWRAKGEALLNVDGVLDSMARLALET
ncbi:hypothetical protein E3P92_00478 [Wallemia ichthyophaga]|uniref:Mitochondrial import inner membrane translocase subunit TIM50 n=2 Tax=Wallemia ichthyophaga TaxID=245174 RepID=A0A4T0GP06_WALIC|nr:uncharacterized protein J056_004269 [Wallemia ichthyophaga EXF-994]TIA82151.1 hypothetical protein E3P98_01583 [Wallemia ichthyophaga]EOR01483.1 hypothetical protein J056_004269 [Wallemia ichthyophaga EXF-994]TIB03382.1 hypothetical protein E3P95_00585 [Wallemia ichthyophaga]TIB04120.1 hypothetical protein E3P94_00684 [Wallemia ichthyophaga]TIB13247.1 hypothetical protein E3P90_01721 [Wallemia ichthyophaga]